MKPVDYTFKALNPIKYKIDLCLYIGNRYLKLIFEKSKEALLKKNIDLKNADISNINQFEIPHRYIYAVKTSITPIMAKIEKNIKKNNIEILKWEIEKGNFKKEKNEWTINIEVKGSYMDKR